MTQIAIKIGFKPRQSSEYLLTRPTALKLD